MTYQSLFMLATAGFTLMATFFLLDRHRQKVAVEDHARNKLVAQVHRAYAKAVRMVRRPGLTFDQRVRTLDYIDRIEAAHRALDLGSTGRFDRLRQTLTLRNRGVREVV